MKPVSISIAFKSCLLFHASPIPLIKQRLGESVADRDLLFADLFDLCDDPNICADMMDVLGAYPLDVRNLFYNHRKRLKRPRMEAFWEQLYADTFRFVVLNEMSKF
jgi:hypothetical protein